MSLCLKQTCRHTLRHRESMRKLYGKDVSFEDVLIKVRLCHVHCSHVVIQLLRCNYTFMLCCLRGKHTFASPTILIFIQFNAHYHHLHRVC